MTFYASKSSLHGAGDQPSPRRFRGAMFRSTSRNSGNSHRNSAKNRQNTYSIPGVLQFIEHEWVQYHEDRKNWKAERSELLTKIAILSGQRDGQRRLIDNLVRRIKMLEYALQQERHKLNSLKEEKVGKEETRAMVNPPERESVTSLHDDMYIPSPGKFDGTQAKDLLRKYLEEIGFVDSVLHNETSRVRTLIEMEECRRSVNTVEIFVDAKEKSSERLSKVNLQQFSSKLFASSSNSLFSDPVKRYSSVCLNGLVSKNKWTASQQALKEEKDVEMKEQESSSCILNDSLTDYDGINSSEPTATNIVEIDSGTSAQNMKERDATSDAEDGEETILDFEGREEKMTDDEDDNEAMSDIDDSDDTVTVDEGIYESVLNEDDGEDPLSAIGLKDIVGLAEVRRGVLPYEHDESFQKSWTPRYTLRGHLDNVRALSFHPNDPMLVTGSEDATLKVWDLETGTEQCQDPDAKAVLSLRGHSGPVLCLTTNSSGDVIFSGGLDGTVRSWHMPNAKWNEPEERVVADTMSEHSDAVWGLRYQNDLEKLLTCSADGTVKVWSASEKVSVITSLASERDGAPTSVDFLRHDENKIVVAFTSSACVIFDLEVGKPIVRMCEETSDSSDIRGKLINRVVTHPILPITISAHEDKKVRFFDSSSGKLIDTRLVHEDAVTSLSLDVNGLYFLTGSHDSALRLWNFDTKECVRECVAHEKKGDESIFDVAFHSKRSLLASAGADGLAKVFAWHE